MFGIEPFKLIIILIAATLLIGPDKLPEIARTIGKFVRMFNAAREEMESTIKADMFAVGDDKPASTEPNLADSLYSRPSDDEDEEEEEE